LIAAVGGVDRRSAKNAARPMKQSREAHRSARPLHSPEGPSPLGRPTLEAKPAVKRGDLVRPQVKFPRAAVIVARIGHGRAYQGGVASGLQRYSGFSLHRHSDPAWLIRLTVTATTMGVLPPFCGGPSVDRSAGYPPEGVVAMGRPAEPGETLCGRPRGPPLIRPITWQS